MPVSLYWQRLTHVRQSWLKYCVQARIINVFTATVEDYGTSIVSKLPRAYDVEAAYEWLQKYFEHTLANQSLMFYAL